MARLELLQGAVMSELNGWQQPLHYGDGASELKNASGECRHL